MKFGTKHHGKLLAVMLTLLLIVKSALCQTAALWALQSRASGESVISGAVESVYGRPEEAEQIQEHVRGYAARGEASSQSHITIGTTLVDITVTAADSYGRFVSGLSKEHFSVFDNGVKQEISHFSDTDSPVSVGIVFDISRSMRDRIRQAARALDQFIRLSHPDDELFLVTFNDRPKLARDFTTSGDDIMNSLALCRPEGSTALYDAVYLAAEKVQQGRHQKKVILIISDGEDNKSRYHDLELRRRMIESDTQVYAIGLTDANLYDDLGFQYGQRVISNLAKMTGGRAFFPNAYSDAALLDICSRIAIELRHQYSLGFYPSATSRGNRWHAIDVRLGPPKGVGTLHLSYRRGYQSF
jgi:Ca-activated chloride channel family protein